MAKYHVVFDFSEEAYKKLLFLEERIENPSKAEVVRCGIGLLSWVSDEIWNGSEILVRKKNGEVKEMVFNFLKKPPSSEKTPPVA